MVSYFGKYWLERRLIRELMDLLWLTELLSINYPFQYHQLVQNLGVTWFNVSYFLFFFENELKRFGVLLACWRPDPHDRPAFDEILMELEKISRSPFLFSEGFHTMQQTWRVEIQDMLQEMYAKEKASSTRTIYALLYVGFLTNSLRSLFDE